jgi:hypothetical protein
MMRKSFIQILIKLYKARQPAPAACAGRLRAMPIYDNSALLGPENVESVRPGQILPAPMSASGFISTNDTILQRAAQKV